VVERATGGTSDQPQQACTKMTSIPARSTGLYPPT
jgi:hypothetical protein